MTFASDISTSVAAKQRLFVCARYSAEPQVPCAPGLVAVAEVNAAIDVLWGRIPFRGLVAFNLKLPHVTAFMPHGTIT